MRHLGKWVLVKIGTKVNEHLGKMSTPSALKRYLKCPVPIFLKCLKMGTGAIWALTDNWGKWRFGGIGTPSILKGYTPSALCPFPPNVCKWALGQMKTWGKWTFGGKRYLKCPEPIFSNVYKWALGANGHLGERGTPSKTRESLFLYRKGITRDTKPC